MDRVEMKKQFEFARRKTLELLESIEKLPNAREVLAWRPAPGRAHIAWQLMHIAASEDRYVNVRAKGGKTAEPEYERRFAGGSTPDDQIPEIGEIRRYLSERREALLHLLMTIEDSELPRKPSESLPYTFEEFFRVYAWHEGHHHGQAHITLNMYKAANARS